MLYSAVLYSAELYSAVLYCAVLYCAVLQTAVLYCAVLYFAVQWHSLVNGDWCKNSIYMMVRAVIVSMARLQNCLAVQCTVV